MKKVTIYSSDQCPYCVAAKEYLDERDIEYEEKNIQNNIEARQELMKMGHMGVPVILVDEEEVVGFDKEKIEKLLSE